MRQAGIGWGLALLLSLMFWATVFIGITQAHADRYCVHWYGVRVFDGWSHHLERRCARWVHGYSPRVYGYERRYDDDDRARRQEQCLDNPVDVLSTEHQSEENARESARKLWMAATQWRFGGQYMNLDEAAHVRWQCGPSNAMDTIAGKISEAAGVLTGRGGQNVRCALWAVPCRTERMHGDERRR